MTRGSVRVGRWYLRHCHDHRTTFAWVHRALRRWIDASVWAALETDPDFTEGIRRGIADSDAGRWYRMVQREDGTWIVPNPDWPKDDPVQPKPERLWRSDE